jgi:hypothetical protein
MLQRARLVGEIDARFAPRQAAIEQRKSLVEERVKWMGDAKGLCQTVRIICI